MRYLVTGGAGFVGGTYVRHLLETSDHQVTVFDALTYAGSLERLHDLIDDPRLSFVHGDVADPGDVAAAGRLRTPAGRLRAEPDPLHVISGEQLIHWTRRHSDRVAQTVSIVPLDHPGVHVTEQVGQMLVADPGV